MESKSKKLRTILTGIPENQLKTKLAKYVLNTLFRSFDNVCKDINNHGNDSVLVDLSFKLHDRLVTMLTLALDTEFQELEAQRENAEIMGDPAESVFKACSRKFQKNKTEQ